MWLKSSVCLVEESESSADVCELDQGPYQRHCLTNSPPPEERYPSSIDIQSFSTLIEFAGFDFSQLL